MYNTLEALAVDAPRAHYETTGPGISRDTNAKATDFVSTMSTTATIVGGCSRHRKEQSSDAQTLSNGVIHVQ